MIRVLIVDDHRIFRQGLYALLMTAKDIQIVGEARDGKEGLELAQRLEPDVILMDIEMPFMDGYEATRQILSSKVPARILILSMRTEERDVRLAAQCGAIGYLIKNCSREELVGAIRAANGGQSASSPEVAPYFPISNPNQSLV